MVPIGEAARKSGVAIETIRYYERAGVVPHPGRAANGRRVYDGAAISRLRLIKRCRDLGFSLEDARALLALSETGNGPCGEVKAIAEAHIAEIRQKIDALRGLEAALSDLVRDCRDGKAPCLALRSLAGG